MTWLRSPAIRGGRAPESPGDCWPDVGTLRVAPGSDDETVGEIPQLPQCPPLKVTTANVLEECRTQAFVGSDSGRNSRVASGSGVISVAS